MRRPTVASASAADRWLAVIAVVGATAAIVIAVSGGFSFRLGGVRFSARGWERPAAAAVLSLLALTWRRRDSARRILELAWPAMGSPSAQRVVIAAACAWALFAGVEWGTFAVGGSDSYGYAAEARLFAAGRMSERLLVPAGFTWPGAESALVPLGFRSGLAPAEIVPSYPPGFPLLMAAAMLVREPVAAFLIVPFLGALSIWAAWRVGLEIGDGLAGALAGILLSVSPTFLYQLVQPMSDVPATASWLLAMLLVSRRGAVAAAAAGVTAGLAISIRPNLAPLVALLAMLCLSAPPRHLGLQATPARARLLLIFVAALAPVVGLLGWIHTIRYGSPLTTGYGSLGDVFSAANVVPNLTRYPRWITETHTWFVWVSAAAPFWICRRTAGRALAWTALAFVVAVCALYLPYASFQPHEWSYTRFLLPAIPLILFFATAIALWLIARLPLWMRSPLVLLGMLIMMVALLSAARSRGVFLLAQQEGRYPGVAAFVAERLPEKTFVFAGQHSGSIRYYADRPTVRWDLLEPVRLDEAVRAVRADGFAPVLVVDATEDAEFRDRFAPAGQHAVDARELKGVVGGARVYVFR